MAKSEYIDNQIKAVAPKATEAEQAEMWDILTTGNEAAPMPFKGSKATAVDMRGRGRPSGSVNKRTMAMASYLLSKYRHPLDVAAAAYSMKPVELLEDLGFKLDKLKPMQYNELIMWAVEFQMRCRSVVEKYTCTPMPAAAAVQTGGGMMPLQVNIGSLGSAAKDVSVCTHTTDAGEKGANSGGGGAAIDAIYSSLSQENQSEIK